MRTIMYYKCPDCKVKCNVRFSGKMSKVSKKNQRITEVFSVVKDDVKSDKEWEMEKNIQHYAELNLWKDKDIPTHLSNQFHFVCPNCSFGVKMRQIFDEYEGKYKELDLLLANRG